MYWKVLHPPQALVGDVLQTGQPAADFTLVDQNGTQVSLSQFRGEPVALTFLYTNCTDVCPLIASNMHTAYVDLGADASRVAMLAVTVDPARDNVDQLQRFSDERHLTDEWHFMTARRPALETVWKSYGILAEPLDAQGSPIDPSSTAVQDPESIEHSAPIFLIDKQGVIRTLLDPTFMPPDLVQDFQSLLG